MWLRAYPWIKYPTVSSIKGKPQAYIRQDHHDPTGLYPHSTRRERQRAWEAKRRAADNQDVNDPTYDHGQALEHRRYVGETLIQCHDQLWTWGLEAGAEHYSLEMCDINTMMAIYESRLLPRTEWGFNPITRSYLTVTLDQDKALLTAQEAIVISAAFPYARGRRQEPLSERILSNDLYGIPLYQLSVGLIGPDQTTGARAAAAVIKTTGADLNFVTDRVVGRTDKPRRYEMGHRPEIDPGPMRYVC